MSNAVPVSAAHYSEEKAAPVRERVFIRVPPTREIQEIARVSLAHARSVERRLLGLLVRGDVSDRIDAELARRGYLPTRTTEVE